jgi:FixJ family two-component response regulator
MSAPITVFVVDSDESVLRAMARLMKASGFNGICLRSMEALMEQDLPSSNAVILLDVRTARQFAETLQTPFLEGKLTLPVIYLTDCGTRRTQAEARRMGAAGYYRKPIDEQALSDAIRFAVQPVAVCQVGQL